MVTAGDPNDLRTYNIHLSVYPLLERSVSPHAPQTGAYTPPVPLYGSLISWYFDADASDSVRGVAEWFEVIGQLEYYVGIIHVCTSVYVYT